MARRQGSPATRIHTHSGHPHARALPPASLTLPDVKHVRSRAQDREESCTTTGSKAQPVSPMDYNPGGGGNFHMMCEYCGTVAEYSADDADDGLFSCHCPRCYAVHTHTSTQAAATRVFNSGREKKSQPTDKTDISGISGFFIFFIFIFIF